MAYIKFLTPSIYPYNEVDIITALSGGAPHHEKNRPVAPAAMHGYAGGHEGRLEFSEDGRLLLKRTTFEEAHFYFWLQRLSHAGPATAPAAQTPAIDANADSSNDVLPKNSICPLGCLADCPLLRLNPAFMTAAIDIKSRERDIRSAKQLQRWVPEAYDVVRAGSEEGEKHPVTLLLENLLFGLSNPVVIDIKMGEG